MKKDKDVELPAFCENRYGQPRRGEDPNEGYNDD